MSVVVFELDSHFRPIIVFDGLMGDDHRLILVKSGGKMITIGRGRKEGRDCDSAGLVKVLMDSGLPLSPHGQLQAI